MIKGSRHTKETKKMISKAIAGENHPNYGKHRAVKIREKISEANKGHTTSNETKEKLRIANRRENNFSWKGGFIKNTEGYTLFNVPDNCRFSCMKNVIGYIHRLLKEKFLQVGD